MQHDYVFWAFIIVGALAASPLFIDLARVLYLSARERHMFNKVVEQIGTQDDFDSDLVDQAVALATKRHEIAKKYK